MDRQESWRLEQQRYKWSNKMDIYLQWIVAILIVLVDLDVHKAFTSLLGEVRLGYFRAGTVVLNRGPGGLPPTWPPI